MSKRQSNGKAYTYRGKTRADFYESRECLWCHKMFEILKTKTQRCCSYPCGMKHYFSQRRVSSLELLFASILEELHVEYEFQFNLLGKYFDFKLKNYNILVETDGIYWHSKYEISPNDTQKKCKQNDLRKNEIAKKYGYVLIRIWEDDANINNVSQLLKEYNVL